MGHLMWLSRISIFTSTRPNELFDFLVFHSLVVIKDWDLSLTTIVTLYLWCTSLLIYV